MVLPWLEIVSFYFQTAKFWEGSNPSYPENQKLKTGCSLVGLKYLLWKQKIGGSNPSTLKLEKKLSSSSARTSAFHVENVGWIPIGSKIQKRIKESNLVVKYEASNFNPGVRFPPFLNSKKTGAYSSMVERRPFKPWVLGSSPNMLKFKFQGVISSGVEQLAVNQKVDGSIPSLPFSIKNNRFSNENFKGS